MANDCLFTLKVRGTNKRNLKAFLNAIKGNRNEHLSRIFDFSGGYDIHTNEEVDLIKEENAYTGEIWGSCAWSVWSCMFEGNGTYYSDFKDKDLKGRTTIDRLCKKYKVRCEIFSEEYGIGFQEHYLIDEDGCVLESECEDAYEVENEEGECEVKGGFGKNYLCFSF